MSIKLLSVGEVGSRSGVAVSAVHFYEAQGLLFSTRTAGNQRRYARDTLRRVAVIRAAQKIGVPLAVVRDAFAALPRHRTPTASDWRGLGMRWRAVLDGRIEQLRQLRDELTGCIGCGCLSLRACPLRNPGDVLGRRGSGPRLLKR